MPANHSVEEIKKIWGKNKTIPKNLEKPFYRAISHYPELKNTYYFIANTKFYGIQHTLRAYPPLLSLFSKIKNRVYPIVINVNKKVALSFYSLSKEQQEGILSHEMAHTTSYTKLSSWQIIKLSLKFALSKNFVKKLEQNTDKLAIARGCGESLLSSREYHFKEVEEKLHEGLLKVYFNPEEIKKEMKKYPKIYPRISFNKRNKLEISNKLEKKNLPSKIYYSLITVFTFFPEIFEMMWYVYIKKIHKKPNWYLKKDNLYLLSH